MEIVIKDSLIVTPGEYFVGFIGIKNGKIKSEQRIKKDFEKLASKFAPVAQW